MIAALPVGVAASAALSDLLSGPHVVARVRGVSGPACYLDVADQIVVVEGHGGAGLPNAVRVTHPGRPPLQLAVGDEVVLGRGALTVDGRELPVHRWWDPYVRVGSCRLDEATVAVVSATLRAVTEGAQPPAVPLPGGDALGDALRRRDGDALAEAALALLGRGPGLTPAGDDMLAGALATLRVLGPSRPADIAAAAEAMAEALAGAVLDAARERTTALSAQLLWYADKAAVALGVGDVLRAIAGRGALVPAAVRLARVGHTSGTDLLTGIGLTVEVLLADREKVRACRS